MFSERLKNQCFRHLTELKNLPKKQGLSINSLEEKLGYSRNTIYNLKNSKPSTERISEIADYFNVSTDYLLGRTDNPTIAKDDTIAGYTSDDLRKWQRMQRHSMGNHLPKKILTRFKTSSRFI